MRRSAHGLVIGALLLASCTSGTNSLPSPISNGGPQPSPGSGVAFKEFPTTATLLGGLAFGSDGNVYFSTTTELGIFTPSNGKYTLIAGRVPDTWPVIPSFSPTGPVAASNETVSTLARLGGGSGTGVRGFSTAQTTPAVAQYDTATKAFTEFYGAKGDVFEDVTMTSDGNAWVTANQPTPHGLTGFVFTTKADCTPPVLLEAIGSVTLGADGFIWIASDPQLNGTTTSEIFRIDPNTGTLANTFALGTGSLVTGLTPGPDGALWFTDAGLNEIGRLAVDGSVMHFPVLSAASGLRAITSGCDGALWFTEQHANRIGRITTTGVVSEYPVPTSNAGVGGIEGCLDGGVFFTEAHAIGEVKPY